MSLIDIHIHGNFDEIEKQLNKIFSSITLIHKEMATKQEFQQALADVTSALENIAADITRLTDQLQNGGLSAADETEVFNQLRAVADRAKTIADTTVDPEVPPTPEPQP
jgi:glutaredoxin 2